MKKVIAIVAMSIVGVLAFSGCGGGGGGGESSSDTTTVATVTGQFIDAPVKGLKYVCSAGVNSRTNNNGEYTCNIGSDVTFYIGTLSIGTVAAQVEPITPYSLFPNNIDAAVNLARILQTLNDGSIVGVINIDAAMETLLPPVIDLTSVSFETTTKTEIENAIGTTLISAVEAKENMDTSILDAGGTVPSASNNIPVANAGVDQNVNTTSTVTLNGSLSSDANLDALTYSWTITSRPTGSSATLSSTTTANPTLVVDIDGSYVIQLVVNDGKVNSVADTVTVIASTSNNIPVANAGVDQNVNTTSTVTLNGSLSSDANLDALTYSWTITSRPTGSSATLSSTTTANPTLVVDIDGSYVIQLVVNDGKVNSVADTVTITSSTPNSVPSATYVSLNTDEDTLFNGTLTGEDTDGVVLTFTKTADALHGIVTISTDGTFSYMPDQNYFGNDTFSYKVNDGIDDSSSQEVSVTINAVNDTPVVNDQNLSVHSRQLYSRSLGASDPENDILSYTVNSAPAFGTFNLDANTGAFTFKPENNSGTTSIIVDVTDGEYTVNANLTFTVSTFDMSNSIEICDSYKLYSNNFSVASGLIQAYSDVTINISNMVDSNLTVTSVILYNGDNTVISSSYGNFIEPNYILKLSGRYYADVTSLENYWIIKYIDALTGNSYISKYTYDSLENTTVSASNYINSTGTIGCYDNTPYHGSYVTEADLGFDIEPIEDTLVSSTKIIPLSLNDAIINNDANITILISPATGMSASYSDGNLTLRVIESETQSNNYTVTVAATKGVNQDIETFSVDYAIQHNVSTTTELRNALTSAAGNGYSDIIVLADGIYATTDDGLGEFYFTDNEFHKLIIKGSSSANVMLSGSNTHRVLHYYNSAGNKYDSNIKSLHLENITIQDGYVASTGAGVFSNGDLYADHIVIKNNHTDLAAFNDGGGICTYNSFGDVGYFANLYLNDSTVENNSAYFGGGIRTWNAQINNSIIRGNTAGNAYGGFSASYAQVYNSIITSNTVEASANNGGAFKTHFSLSLVNSLVSNNGSGIALIDGDSNYIVNTIFNNNGPYDIKFTDPTYYSATVNINYSFFNGVMSIPYFGSNNISTGYFDFIDEVNGDYHLNSNSVLIDAGTDTSIGVIVPTTDLDGNPRKVGITVDIGPYEFQ